MFIFRIISVYIFILSGINGSHFLGGTITWRPLNASATGSPVAVIITKQLLGIILLGSPVSNVGTLASVTLQCINNCGVGSTGYPSNISVIPICTGFSAPIGTTVGQRSDIVYLASGDDFSVAFALGSWRDLATVIGAGWSLATKINLTPRSDNGLYNSAPVATVMSPIYVNYNETVAIQIPVGDADGDIVRCRWATRSNGINECGDVCPPGSLPPNTVIYPNCTMIVTGFNISDWYAVALMIEDFINSSSTTPLSSVPVQFLMQVVSPATCIIPPEIIGIPAEQSCTPVVVGQTFLSRLIAINNCGVNVTIVDIAILPFTGLIANNLTKQNSTTYYRSFSWIPTTLQLGYQVLCAMALNNQNSQSAQYCFTFYVSQNATASCPDATVTIATIPTTTTVTETTTDWTDGTTDTPSTITITSASVSTTSISNISISYISSTSHTTTTTTKQKPNSIDWPFIGVSGGLFLLLALTLGCCLCWYYLCPMATRRYVHMGDATPILYHIERCTDPNCKWPDRSNLSDMFVLPVKNHHVCNIKLRNLSYSTSINTDTKSNVSSFPSTQLSLLSQNHTSMKKSANVTVSTVKIKDIKRSNREIHPKKEAQLFNVGNIKVSRIPWLKKPKSSSFHNRLSRHSILPSVSYRSDPTLNNVRVTRVRSLTSNVNWQSTINDTHLSDFEDTIYLDNCNETKQNSFRMSTTDSQLKHNHLCQTGISSESLTLAHSPVRVKYVPRPIKKKYSHNSSPLSTSLRKTQKTNRRVIVKHVSRKSVLF